MSDDLFDHYAREFNRAAAGRRAPMRFAVPAAVALAAVLAVFVVPAADDREIPATPAAAAPPDAPLVLKVGPPPLALRELHIGVADRSGAHQGARVISSLNPRQGWKVAQYYGAGPVVPRTYVAYTRGHRSLAQQLANAVGVRRVAPATADVREQPVTIVVGEQPLTIGVREQPRSDGATKGAAATFSALGPDDVSRTVETAYGDVNISRAGGRVCLTTRDPSGVSSGGVCSLTEDSASGSLGIIFLPDAEKEFDQPFRAVGLVPDGVPYVTFHGERVDVRDNVWAAPPSRGDRNVTIPGIGVKSIAGLSPGQS